MARVIQEIITGFDDTGNPTRMGSEVVFARRHIQFSDGTVIIEEFVVEDKKVGKSLQDVKGTVKSVTSDKLGIIELLEESKLIDQVLEGVKEKEIGDYSNSIVNEELEKLLPERLEKKFLTSLISRVAQFFRGKSGFWVTTKTGRRLFIDFPGLKNAETAVDKFFGTSIPRLGSEFFPSFRLNRINRKINQATASLLSENNPMRAFLNKKTSTNVLESSWAQGDFSIMEATRVGVSKVFGGKVLGFIPRESPRWKPFMFSQLTDKEISLRLIDAAESMSKSFGVKNLKAFHVDELMQNWVKVRYVVTQRMLNKAKINKVSLWRGLNLEKDEFQTFLSNPPVLQVGALSSWSTKKDWALLYGNIHMNAEIPTRNILWSASTGGRGMHEWTVLGNNLETQIRILEGTSPLTNIFKRMGRIFNIDENVNDLMWLQNLLRTAGVQTQKAITEKSLQDEEKDDFAVEDNE